MPNQASDPNLLNYESPQPQPPPAPLFQSCLHRLAIFFLALTAALAFGFAAIYLFVHWRP